MKTITAILLAAAGVAPLMTAGCTSSSAGSAGSTLDAILGAPPGGRTGLVENFALGVDLDGDGKEETVRLAWLSGGGSGTFDSLVVSRGAANDYLYTAPLGDRVQVRSATAQGSTVVLETLQASATDAMCCVGQKFRRTFALREGQLVETGTVDEGRISTADLGGNWQLVTLGEAEPLPPDVSITLTFTGNRISGSSGCNRYMGLVAPAEPPRGIRISGALAGTRMACAPPVDAVEQDYLRRLEKIYLYGFLAGRLVISWGDADARGLLTYQRAD